MKAARVLNGELGIHDVDSPTPGVDQALLRITASGVCHSDLHLARGDWYGMQPPSLGHEAIGIVEDLGPGADRFVKVGDRVIVGLGGSGGGFWCGACEFCLRGQPRLCAQTQNVMGTFAEQFVVYAPGLVTLPDSIPDTEAPLACGGLTAYGAVKKVLKHGVLPGRPVAVIGAAGGLGHYAVQLADGIRIPVIGVDIGEARLDFVRSLGAELAVDPDSAAEVVQRDIGGVDAVLVFSAGSPATTSVCSCCARPDCSSASVCRRRARVDSRSTCSASSQSSPRSSSPRSGTCRTCASSSILPPAARSGRTSTAPARCPTSTRSSRSSRPASSSDAQSSPTWLTRSDRE